MAVGDAPQGAAGAIQVQLLKLLDCRHKAAQTARPRLARASAR